MNVRELERQLGIPRANIRYYEKEGLLHPRRTANNYRDYTEEDVETLKKIRLLRQLDMPVETIRAVQAGEVPLGDALARQERLLENEAVKLEQARTVCRSMLADGATYQALDPARYEGVTRILPERAAEPPRPKRPPVEGAEWAFDPWQRFWARRFDVGLAAAAVEMGMALVFHVSVLTAGNSLNARLLQVLLLALGWMLVLVLEPLLLCTWGTTPGKWLLGLELRDERGGKLRFLQGLRRTWGVLGTGYGFEIPIFRWYTKYRCYKECREDKPLNYDYEQGNLYYSRTPGRWGLRAALSVALLLLLIPAQMWCSAQALLPPNRGEITAEEFAENVNAVADHLGYSLWVNGEGFELARQTVSFRVDDGDWEERRYGEPFDDAPVYTVETDENGYVTAVNLMREEHFSGDDVGWTYLPVGTAQTVTAAFRGAWCSGYDMLRGPVPELLEQPPGTWDGRTVRDGGFALTVTLEKEGYLNNTFMEDSGPLIPQGDGNRCWYRFTLRLERAG